MVCNGANGGQNSRIWAAAQSGAEKLDCKNYYMQLLIAQRFDFGRTKPNCAVLSMDP
jgi:hypothetical protein